MSSHPARHLEEAAVTEAEWDAERARTRRVAIISSAIGFVLVPSLGFPALFLTNVTVSGAARYPVTVAWLALLFTPFTYLMVRANMAQQRRSDDVVATLTRQSARAADIASAGAELREEQARRQEFESRLANALEMAEAESEVIDVIERSFAATLPDSACELLLADNSHAHLLRMATASPTDQVPGCSVNSPDRCPAARRAQVQLFSNSENIDACPKLRDRGAGAVSALCVPVSIMGRTVGVIHSLGEADVPFTANKVQEIATIANLAGARIGLLRVMADTQLQASTDSLTGLLNRRSFEQKLSVTRGESSLHSLAMADLDHFKPLNDTYGHETGDRALRLFSEVLRSSFRAQDLLCRHGGEEFLIAFPACTALNARKAIEGLRTRLAAAVTVAGLPAFTVSVGVIEDAKGQDLPKLITRADSALFAAKRAGRDRVIVHDEHGVVVEPDPAPASGSLTRH